MLAKERQDYIVKKINENGTVNVKQLANDFQVSEMTIRRDLEDMEAKGLLLRIHGGAQKIDKEQILSMNGNQNMYNHMRMNGEEKNAVCKKAAEFVEWHDCVYLDGGTTLVPFLKYIENKKLKIVTHNTLVIQDITSNNHEVFGIGGSYSPDLKMMVGPLALEQVRQFNFDVAFIGCAGVDIEKGLVYTVEMETRAIKKEVMSRAKRKYLLLDSSKLKIKGFCNFVELSEFDGIICDDSFDYEGIELPENFILAKVSA